MNNELYHQGIKGQKWGRRRWQNEDGTFNEAGKERYFHNGGPTGFSKKREVKKAYKQALKQQRAEASKEAAKVYADAEKYAEKHGLDVDDVVYPDERKEYLKNHKEYGISRKTAEHVIEYSKRLDAAEIKENEIYKKHLQEAKNMVCEKYGKANVSTFLDVVSGDVSNTKLTINPSDSSVTKDVKNDFNTLSDKEFKNRYSTSKLTYAKRVLKYGDPYERRKQVAKNISDVV